MKKVLQSIVLLLICAITTQTNGQNLLITDDAGYNAHGSAMLDVKSIEKGILLPRLTSAERTAISSPAKGLIVFDSDQNEFYYYDGALWKKLTSGLTGDYNELTNKPDFTGWDTNVSDDFNGQYSNLTGAPVLSPVATSGSYNDLTDKPVIPSAANGAETKVTAGTNVAVSGTGTTASPYVVRVAPGTAAGQTQYWNGTQWITNNNIYNNGANVGIGTNTPASKLSVGTNSEFQVNNTGNIVKLNNVTTSFPSAQGDANSFLSNDGSGNLSWTSSPSLDNVTVDGHTVFEKDWSRQSDFGGTARYHAIGFSIGTKGYIGTGDENGVPKMDFWEYDSNTKTWSQKANFGGSARYGATAFAIGTKGYVGTGYNAGYKNDFWEYNPATNSWTQKASFGGVHRAYATGFAIGSKGYIGTGHDGNDLNDFWEYDAGSDTWTQKAAFGGGIRSSAAGFAIDSKGYIGTGTSGFQKKSDFWEYNPATDTWAQKADCGGGIRTDAAGFVIGSKGFICLGVGDVVYRNDCWEYDPNTDSWAQRANFAGSARSGAVGFAIGSTGYIGTGYNGYAVIREFWEYSMFISDDVLIASSGFSASAYSPGLIFQYAGNGAPAGYLICDGEAVSREEYANLFAAIGINYGAGNGSTTFNLPDLTGRIAVMQSLITDFNTLGKTGGEEYHYLVESEMPTHKHDFTVTGGGAHSHSWNGFYNANGGSNEARSRSNISSDATDLATNSNTGGHSHTVTQNNKGSGTGHYNLQPYIVVKYIIKY